MNTTDFLTRVVLKNYKSIAACDLSLRQLMFLVGPNGAGKSNFLDALRFVADALRTSLDHALRDRGGIKEVRRRSGGHPTHFGIRLDFTLKSGLSGHYAFRIGARPRGTYQVQVEECTVRGWVDAPQERFFRVKNGKVISSTRVAPAASKDRLYLVNASGLPEFRPVYEALSSMSFYNLNPARIRELQEPHTGDLLSQDGSNVASVLGELAKHAPKTKERIENYLSRVIPGVFGVDSKAIGPRETLEFRQGVAGAQDPWRFPATNMSDGTLRALGILVALFQSGDGNGPYVPLVGIEEPEIALHPAATGVLLDALWEASHSTQVIVTSHSPDLLDSEDLDTDSVFAVIAEEGITKIGQLDEAGKTALRDRLYTAGELLRLNQLAPDLSELKNATKDQFHLFDKVGD